MSNNSWRWMPHHEGAVPPAGQGKRISTYNVALEGWRRGLQLDFYGVIRGESELKIRYTLSNENRKHEFQLSMGDKVTDKAFDICEDKNLTKKYLSEFGVPVPEGSVFDEDSTDEDVLSYVRRVGYPLVVKPTDGNAGKGVFANITENDDLLDIFHYVRDELGYKEIIIERYISGDEFRIVVIEDRVLGSMNRRPANVIGDGKSTIRELIKEKNKIRLQNPHLTSRLIKIDREVHEMLKRVGYKLSSVPPNGERVYLREKSNLSAGGDAIDTTEELTEEIKQIAINAGKAIPGLAHYGVDMIVDAENNTGVILEVNARPGLGGHLFPMEGAPRDFAKEIIDYYFPETKGVERSFLYFDFDSIIEPIKKRQAKRVKLKKAPTGKLYGKRYTVSGKVQKVGYRNWIKKQAQIRGLHGFTNNEDDGTVQVVIMGTDKDIVNNFKFVCYEGPKKAEVEEVIEFDWNKPVKLNFEIVRPELDLTRKEISDLIKEKEELENEKNRLAERIEKLTKSKSWRYTELFRKTLKRLNKK